MNSAQPTKHFSNAPRVRVDGKFFRLGDKKFYLKGITYGPFSPDDNGETFASREQTKKDFQQIAELGANLIRVYYVPPRWLLDLAQEYGIKVLVDIPWEKHRCFLDSYEAREDARKTVRDAVTQCKDHPAIFAYSVVNEIPAEIVRWSGERAVAEFIDGLIEEARAIDPGALYTFTSFPPTEFLLPQNIDFVCFNVYLHQRKSLEGYLARLQTLADARPLVFGEFGVDSFREGEDRKCEMLAWQIEAVFRAGLAGAIIFSYTDDWWRGGHKIEDWSFGLTLVDRTPKKSFGVVQKLFRVVPHFELPRTPKVSVVVASYNGASTLRSCLESVQKLNYPNYEVILVDDGSTDNTQAIAADFPKIINIKQTNKGLSAARNAGIKASTGEIVAFTDSDCRADEDWLFYLVSEFLYSDFAGVGGHNFLPPEDSPVAAAVMASPGGPVHVMLTDRDAEHIPGCNMAFYKFALDEIGGFDPVYRKAGDDVDVCWRLLEAGYKIGFTPAGFVWHHRRSTVKAYLKQQSGYGEAEALLVRKHPEYFNFFGGGIWHGRIYTLAKFGIVLQRSVIYHGIFGSGFFQRLYAPQPAFALMLSTFPEFHLLLTLPLALLSFYFDFFWPLAAGCFALSAGVCVMAGLQAELPKKKRRVYSRPLVALMFFLQPIVRGWARYKGRLQFQPSPQPTQRLTTTRGGEYLDEVFYWSKKGVDRLVFLDCILAWLEAKGWPNKWDSGWDKFDLEIRGGRWSRLRLTTVSEELQEKKKFFRCRLETRWSLLAKILFWSTLVGEIFLINFFAEVQPWIWMSLLFSPLFIWFIQDAGRQQQEQIAALMDEVAEELKLEKYEYEKEAKAATSTLHQPTPAAEMGK